MRLKETKFALSALLLIIVLVACQPNQKNASTTSSVEKTDSCLVNAANKYHVYLPAHEKAQKRFPLLVAIDPHGDGKLAVNQFKNAANEYSSIVVGSSLIQNNDPNYLSELEELVNDVKSRYPVNDRIFLAGFSGGARMVLNYAANHAVNGVIACGAFANQNQLSAIKCPVMSITGMDDFNFMESAQYILKPEKMPANVMIEITHASHAWPDKKILTMALGAFQAKEMSHNKHQIKAYVNGQLSRIDSLKRAGEWLQAGMISRNMGLNPDFNAIGKFKSETTAILKNSNYTKQRNELLNGLQFEMKVRKAYLKAMEEKNQEWWSNEIASLNSKIDAETNPISRNTYQRIKGFLGIVCYSYCNRYAAQKNVKGMEQTLMVYRLVEPDNEDMEHFTNVLAAIKAD